MPPEGIKELVWVGSSLEDLKEFPEDVQDVIGYALHVAQMGGKHRDTKPLGGDPAFRGSGVLEVVDDYDGDTYRAVYTVRYRELVYVLHCFQKKSKHGIATPQQDIERVKRRLKVADDDYTRRVRDKP
jgi:phage-related protein